MFNLFTNMTGAGLYDEADSEGDNWRTIERGVHQFGGILHALGKQVAKRTGADYLAERFDRLELEAREAADAATRRMSPSQQRTLSTPIMSDEFLQDPIKIMWAKFLETAPMIAGGVASSVAGGAVGGTAGVLGAGALFGGMTTAGEFVQSVEQAIDETSDVELAENPYVKTLLSEGKSMEEARDLLRTSAIGYSDVFSFGLGAALGAVAPETMIGGQIAKTGLANLGKKAGMGRVTSAGVGTVAGFGSEAAQGAVPAYHQNLASERTEGVVPEVDVLEAAIEEGVMGAPVGTTAGFLSGGKPPPPKANSQVNVTQNGQPTPAQTAAINQTPIPPPGPVPAGAAAGAPQPATVPPKTPPATPAPAAIPPTAPSTASVDASQPGPTVPEAAAAQPTPAAVPAATPTAPPATPAPSRADQTFERAKELVWTDGRASTSYIQRKLGVSYNTAANMVDRLEAEGVVSPADNAGRRTILKDRDGNPITAPAPVEPDAAVPDGPGATLTSEVAPEAPAQPVEGPVIEQGAPESAVPEQGALGPTPQTAAASETSYRTPIEGEPADLPPAPASVSEAFTDTPAAPQEVSDSFVDRPGPPRVLEAELTDVERQAFAEDAERRRASNYDARTRQANFERAAEIERAKEEGTYVSERKDLNNAQKSKKYTEDPAKAKEIFTSNPPASYDDINVVLSRLDKIIADANTAKVSIPQRVKEDTPVEVMWLADVKKTADAIRKNPNSPKAREALLKFIGGEVAALDGDWSVMRMGHMGSTAGRGVTAAAEGGVDNYVDTNEEGEVIEPDTFDADIRGETEAPGSVTDTGDFNKDDAVDRSSEEELTLVTRDDEGVTADEEGLGEYVIGVEEKQLRDRRAEGKFAAKEEPAAKPVVRESAADKFKANRPKVEGKISLKGKTPAEQVAAVKVKPEKPKIELSRKLTAEKINTVREEPQPETAESADADPIAGKTYAEKPRRKTPPAADWQREEKLARQEESNVAYEKQEAETSEWWDKLPDSDRFKVSRILWSNTENQRRTWQGLSEHARDQLKGFRGTEMDPTKPKATSEVTKPKDIVAKAKQARAETATPTPAQAKAGNYRKGKLALAGLGFRMETPIGKYRQSTEIDPVTGAPTWAVKMEDADYGYIENTTGKDGDPVDVFVGKGIKTFVGQSPDAQIVYVIDQNNLDGAFDEHKVMIAFENVRDAVESYFRAFSDGSGRERFGGVTPMDLEQFKEWLKNGTQSPAAEYSSPTAVPTRIEDITQESDITATGDTKGDYARGKLRPKEHKQKGFAELMRGIDPDWVDPFEAQLARSDAAKNQLGAVEHYGHWFVPSQTISLSDALKDSSTARGVFDQKLADVVARAAGDVDVFIVTDEQISDIFDDVVDGMYSELVGSTNKPGIFIPERIWNEAGDYRDSTVVHEGIHAVTVTAIASSSNFEATFNSLIDYIADKHSVDRSDFYGLENPAELMAELSNPEFRELLRNTVIPRQLGQEFGLVGWRKATAWNAIVDFIRKALGLNQHDFTALEVVLSTFDRLSHRMDAEGALDYSVNAFQSGAFNNKAFSRIENNFTLVSRLADKRTEALTKQGQQRRKDYAKKSSYADIRRVITERAANSGWKNNLKRLHLKIASNDVIMRAYEHLFPEGKLRSYINATAKRFSLAQRMNTADAEVLSRKAAVFKKHEGKMIGKRTVQEVYEQLEQDQSNWNLNAGISLAANRHLGKDALRGMSAKAQYPRLRTAWAELHAVDPELTKVMEETRAYYAKKFDAMSEEILTNMVLNAADGEGNTLVRSDANAIAKRMMDNASTSADIATMGQDNFNRLGKVPEFRKMQGFYVPHMRFGNYVVEAVIDVKPPNFGSWDAQPERGVYDFKGKDARRAAIKYVDRQEHATIETIYTDANGNEFFTDPNTGKPVKYSAKDAVSGAERRFRVRVQDRQSDAFESEAEANAAVAKLRQDPYYASVEATRIRPSEGGQRVAAASSRQLQAIADSLSKRDALKGLPPALAADVRAAVQQATYRAAPGTSISKRRLQRKHVAGASTDSMRVQHTYMLQANNYLAALQTAPEIDGLYKELSEFAKNDATTEGVITRQDVLNELYNRRMNHNGMPDDGGNSVINTVVGIQTIDKLMSPAYSMINMLQLGMVTMPEIASKHGVFNASREIGRALSDIGFRNILKAGFNDSFAAMAGRLEASTSYTDFVKKGIKNADERAMLDRLVEVGTIDPDSGFEAIRVVNKGAVSNQLLRLDTIFRQFPRSVEAMNRHAAALAAYRLGRKKGMGHDAAVNYAQDVTNKTQFNYSPENSSPLFNHPLGRIALQFKKYGLAMYQLMGSHIYGVLKDKGNRAEHAKALAVLFGAHAVMAGTMGGLPTEPLRVMLTALNMAGVTDATWEDVELAGREMAADMVGATWGEAITRGLPRMINQDLSSRISLNNLMAPQAFFDLDKPEGVSAYMWSLVAGPTGGMVTDVTKGITAAAEGKGVEAAEYLIPIKAASDLLKAYRYATDGKETVGGALAIQYTLPEAALKALGFTPGREAETYEFMGAEANYRKNYQKTRNELLTGYAEAEGADRIKFFNQNIRKYNAGRPFDERISLGDANNYKKNRDKRLSEADRGVVPTATNRRRLEELQQTFPVR